MGERATNTGMRRNRDTTGVDAEGLFKNSLLILRVKSEVDKHKAKRVR